MSRDPSTPSFALHYAVRSDVGMRRATNQDSVAVAPGEGDRVESRGDRRRLADGVAFAGACKLSSDRVLMVADGMGGHAAGELASRIAAEAIPHAYLKSRDPSPAAALRGAIREANARIHAKGESAAELADMGTTCSCLVLLDGAALVAHVGDSRVYRLRGGRFEQLTSDHSLVWEMAAATNVSEDKVPSCIPKNVITRSLGPKEAVLVDLEGPHPLADGDVYLLCTDGLSGVVEEPLTAALLAELPPDDAAQTLIDVANLRGGPDNVSVVVARVVSEEPGSAPLVPLPAEKVWERLGWAAAAAACVGAFAWRFAHDDAAGMIFSAAACGAAALLAAQGGVAPVAAPAGTRARSLGGPYGNGPYRTIDCVDPTRGGEALRALVAELADSGAPPGPDSTVHFGPPKVGTMVVDWGPFAEPQREADLAADRGDWPAAVRAYAAILRAVMGSARDSEGTWKYRSASSPA